MAKYRDKTPDEVMKAVARDIIKRAVKYSKKQGRTIYISKTARGKGVAVTTLDPGTEEGRKNLEAFLASKKRQYVVYGLGSPGEPNAVNWRKLNLPWGRRMLLAVQIILSLFMKGTPFKNKFLRWMGVHVGQGTEIMQTVWLDHFRPELIFIGENTLMGAFSQVTVHGYEGHGKFRFGLVEIGSHCTLSAGTKIGPIKIGDHVRTLPNTTLTPYLGRVQDGAIVGGEPPLVRSGEDSSREREREG